MYRKLIKELEYIAIIGALAFTYQTSALDNKANKSYNLADVVRNTSYADINSSGNAYSIGDDLSNYGIESLLYSANDLTESSSYLSNSNLESSLSSTNTYTSSGSDYSSEGE